MTFFSVFQSCVDDWGNFKTGAVCCGLCSAQRCAARSSSAPSRLSCPCCRHRCSVWIPALSRGWSLSSVSPGEDVRLVHTRTPWACCWGSRHSDELPRWRASNACNSCWHPVPLGLRSEAVQAVTSSPGLLVLLYSLPSMHYPAKTLVWRGEMNLFFKKTNKQNTSLAFHLRSVAPGCPAVISGTEAVALFDIKCITSGCEDRGPLLGNFVPACRVVNYLLSKSDFSLWRQRIWNFL